MSPRPVPVSRARWVAAALAVTGLMLGSSRASAETVSLDFTHTTGTAPVGVTINGGAPVSITPGPYYWQQTGSPMNSNFGSTVATFCVELNQGFPAGTSSGVYTVNSLASVKGTATADAIQKLFANNYSTAWASSSFAGSTTSTAFQLALWELVTDGTGGNLGSGNFTYTGSLSSGVGLAAKNMLTALGSTSSSAFGGAFPNTQVAWLSSGSFQDQIVVVPKIPDVPGVPAPPSILLAGLALGTGLFGRAFRRRKEVADAVK